MIAWPLLITFQRNNLGIATFPDSPLLAAEVWERARIDLQSVVGRDLQQPSSFFRSCSRVLREEVGDRTPESLFRRTRAIESVPPTAVFYTHIAINLTTRAYLRYVLDTPPKIIWIHCGMLGMTRMHWLTFFRDRTYTQNNHGYDCATLALSVTVCAAAQMRFIVCGSCNTHQSHLQEATHRLWKCFHQNPFKQLSGKDGSLQQHTAFSDTYFCKVEIMSWTRTKLYSATVLEWLMFMTWTGIVGCVEGGCRRQKGDNQCISVHSTRRHYTVPLV